MTTTDKKFDVSELKNAEIDPKDLENVTGGNMPPPPVEIQVGIAMPTPSCKPTPPNKPTVAAKVTGGGR